MSNFKYLISREQIILLPLDGRPRVTISSANTPDTYTKAVGLLKSGELVTVATLYLGKSRPALDTSKVGGAAFVGATVVSGFTGTGTPFALTPKAVGAPVGQKYTSDQVREVKRLLGTVGNLHTIARQTGMSRRHIARIRDNRVHATIV